LYQNLIIHCTNTKVGENIPDKKIEEMYAQGYNYIIKNDGSVNKLTSKYAECYYTDSDFSLTNLGGKTLHIILQGGIDKDDMYKDTLTWKQWDSLEHFVMYHYNINKDINIVGYNEEFASTYPCFSVPNYLDTLGIVQLNYIYE
jgi:hypothetical protein